MANFNDAIMQFLMQAMPKQAAPMDQRSLNPAGMAGGTTGPAAGFGDLPSMPSTMTPPSGGSMPSDMRTMNAPPMQPFAPNPTQNAAAGPMADGAQMPPGVLATMFQKLLGVQPQGQQLDARGGMGQIAPDWRPN
jgi:hypothetical protein